MATARTLVREPALILCDEPTGNRESATTGLGAHCSVWANNAGQDWYRRCMTTVSVHKLKDSLSMVLASVEAGESVEVTRYGKPIAIITGVAHGGRPINVDPGSVQCEDFHFTPDELDEILDGPVFPQ